MEAYIQSYTTDASKVKKVFGCKNKLFLETISKKLQLDIEDIDDEYDAQIDENNNTTKVLENIINGEIKCQKIPFIYGLLYEKIVAVFGEQIYSPTDEYHFGLFDAFFKENTAFMPIPTDYNLPKIYSISLQNLTVEKQKIEAIVKLTNTSTKELEIAKKDYLFAIDKALKLQKDLVFVLNEY